MKISSGNENLQSHILMLRQNKSGTTIAKLTKELIKLAESYKVPELKFDKQASKRRFNYQAWLMKIQPILVMFLQTSSVLPHGKVVPFSDPHAIGNRALYLLIASRADSYFQWAIKQFEPFGDKALELLQEPCAHISREDKSYFPEQLIGLKIRENERASSIIKCFTYAKTTSEAASNKYMNEQLVDFVLVGIRSSQQDVYHTSLQLYCLERLQGKSFTLWEIKQNFFQIDESIRHEKRQLRTEHAMAAGCTYRDAKHHGGPGRHGLCGRGRGRGAFRPQSPSTAAAHAAQQSTTGIICYKCGAPGHIAPDCPNGTRTAPPARGHAAAAQEGNTTDTGSTSSSSVRGTSWNALVCMARTIRYESAMSARRILDYGSNPTLCQPPPQPILVLETVTSGTAILTIDRLVTMVLPINIGQFNDFVGMNGTLLTYVRGTKIRDTRNLMVIAHKARESKKTEKERKKEKNHNSFIADTARE
jgi:hypothetical protein